MWPYVVPSNYQHTVSTTLAFYQQSTSLAYLTANSQRSSAFLRHQHKPFSSSFSVSSLLADSFPTTKSKTCVPIVTHNPTESCYGTETEHDSQTYKKLKTYRKTPLSNTHTPLSSSSLSACTELTAHRHSSNLELIMNSQDEAIPSIKDAFDCEYANENDRIADPNANLSAFLRRSNRKRNATDIQNTCCPICSLSIRLSDLPSHVDLELAKLDKLTNCPGSVDCFARMPNSNEKTFEQNYKSRYLRYLKIKENRQLRLKNRLCLRVQKNSKGVLLCPICIEPLSGTKDEINMHLMNCSNQKEDNSSVDNERDIDIETTTDFLSTSIHEVFEEYEWAGQKRIRTVTLLNDPIRDTGATQVKNEEYDGELNVDSDEYVLAYGKPQFSESDIIPIDTDDSSVEILRKAVIGELNNTNYEMQNSNRTDKSIDNDSDENSRTNNNSKTSKCLICMEPYNNALVSINCWHVYCKLCWLQTLGAKKLCPQCNIITTAEDLRRIDCKLQTSPK